jgi:hypothetical protein
MPSVGESQLKPPTSPKVISKIKLDKARLL